MPFVKYKYPSEISEEWKDEADEMYKRCVEYRAKQGDRMYGGYNVAVFRVNVSGAKGYFTTKSDYNLNEHSEPKILAWLKECGISKSDIVAVFTEWPPCVSPRRESVVEKSTASVSTFKPHPCAIILGNVLLEGTPVFYGSGPTL